MKLNPLEAFREIRRDQTYLSLIADDEGKSMGKIGNVVANILVMIGEVLLVVGVGIAAYTEITGNSDDNPDKPVVSASANSDPLFNELEQLGMPRGEMDRFLVLMKGLNPGMRAYNKSILMTVYGSWIVRLKEYIDQNPNTVNSLNLQHLINFCNEHGKLLFYREPTNQNLRELVVPRYRELLGPKDFTLASRNFSALEMEGQSGFKDFIWQADVPYYDSEKRTIYFPEKYDRVGAVFAWIALYDAYQDTSGEQEGGGNLSATRIMVLFKGDLPDGLLDPGLKELMGAILFEQRGTDVVTYFTASPDPEEMVQKTAAFLPKRFPGFSDSDYKRFAWLIFRSLVDSSSEPDSKINPELGKAFKAIMDKPDLIIKHWLKSEN